MLPSDRPRREWSCATEPECNSETVVHSTVVLVCYPQDVANLLLFRVFRLPAEYLIGQLVVPGPIGFIPHQRPVVLSASLECGKPEGVCVSQPFSCVTGNVTLGASSVTLLSLSAFT